MGVHKHPCVAHVPVAQLDKASDYESEDWGFESLQGYPFVCLFTFWRCTCQCDLNAAWMPERSKGADLRSAGRKSAWVRTPLQAIIFCCSSFVSVTDEPFYRHSSLHGLMDKAHPS